MQGRIGHLLTVACHSHFSNFLPIIDGTFSPQIIVVNLLRESPSPTASLPSPPPTPQIIAVNLPADEISGMREIFLDIDKDHSGSISAEEFAQALRKKGNNLPEEDVMRLVRVRGGGSIPHPLHTYAARGH